MTNQRRDNEKKQKTTTNDRFSFILSLNLKYEVQLHNITQIRSLLFTTNLLKWSANVYRKVRLVLSKL